MFYPEGVGIAHSKSEMAYWHGESVKVFDDSWLLVPTSSKTYNFSLFSPGTSYGRTPDTGRKMVETIS